MNAYACAYLGAAAIALLATPVVGFISRKINILDLPGVRKIHAMPIPRSGGIAIFAATAAVIVGCILLDTAAGKAYAQARLQVIMIGVAALLVWSIGLIDDIRRVKPHIKLAVQVFAAVLLCIAGVTIKSVSIPGVVHFDLGIFSWPITILWITGITNAMNLIDGLDGLAAGIATIAAGVMTFFAFSANQPLIAVMMLALVGGLTGFLAFNFNPAKIFMGDSGSMFVGFFLASASVFSSRLAGNTVGLGILALAMGVPIFDTLFSILRRFLERRHLFSPDQNHLHHRLLRYGLSQRQAVLVMYLTTAAAGGAGILMMSTTGLSVIAVFACSCLFLVLVFRVFGSVRLIESYNKLRSNLKFARDIRHQHIVFEHAQLRIREAEDFDHWWKAVCTAAHELGLARIRLTMTANEGNSEILWKNGLDLDKVQVTTTTVPINWPDKARPPLQAQVDVPIGTSLESAALRLQLFSRLIDEISPTELPWPKDFSNRFSDVKPAEPVATQSSAAATPAGSITGEPN